MAGVCLQFAPLSSAVDAGFWWKLSQKKLDVFKLEDDAIDINGFYCNGDPPHMPGRLNLDYTAFDGHWKPPPYNFSSAGSLYCKNTIEDFKTCDKKQLLDHSASRIWEAIKSGKAIDHPSQLNRFVLLTYVDMKKYCFYYWFAFPAICFPESMSVISSPQRLDQYFSSSQLVTFGKAYEEFITNANDRSYFILHTNEENISLYPLKDFLQLQAEPGKILFGFCDPCSLANHPGWPLRNFLSLIAYHWPEKAKDLEVLCFRERYKDGVKEIGHSLCLHLATTDIKSFEGESDLPGSVGWEKNENQKKGPRKVNLSASMDPHKLAETSIDLNLKLMRWRLVPKLDLERIRDTRCLLLGSGTLGCNVARGLMGWGIRNITFVDNGNVSYSNPVRQSLYNFEDCLQGGKPKAKTAASALKRIFPEINTVGVNLSIPMPGHYVPENATEQIKSDVEKLENLIENHDAVFLLTDTRESRWLPTVLAAVKKKLVINAALGFDTFLVMRHGVKSNNLVAAEASTSSSQLNTRWLPGTELGCYFCNDVVAPGDSTQNRSMDQQCTVTRPGISLIASALAVELLVSTLQHPDGGLAPADSMSYKDEYTGDSATPLGIIPHQIRGFLSRFYHILPVCKCFDKCTACSNVVLDEYVKEGFAFLLNAFNQPAFLEDLTGLTQLHVETQEAEVWELSDGEFDDDTDSSFSCCSSSLGLPKS